MTKEAREWKRLQAFMYAKKHAPRHDKPSKRTAKKYIGKARGQRFLKEGYITEEVHMETIFKPIPQVGKRQ